MDLTTKVKKLPTGPGVYLFKHHGQTLYVGKAINLRRRVSSYFRQLNDLPPKTQLLVSQVTDIETLETAGEFDAILLEARLIHELQPKYNVIARDDKSPLYIVITLAEALPRLVLARKKQLDSLALRRRDVIFGPFQSAKMTRSILGKLRHVIPFCLAKRRTGKPCFYTHLGLCNPCPSEIVKMTHPARKKLTTQLYRRQLLRLTAILSGRTTQIKKDLFREMESLAKTLQFEKAAVVKEQLTALENILTHHYDPAVYLNQTGAVGQDIYQVELDTLRNLLRPFFPELPPLTRVECVDIANLADQYSSGSLIVFSHGRPDSSFYRHFRIKTVKSPNDQAMIEEVIKRRLTHLEWPLPQLLVVDGGKAQIRAAQHASQVSRLKLPIVGIAKRWEEIIIPKPKGGFVTLRLPAGSPALHLVQRVRDEAHRFARRYFQLLRQRTLEQTIGAVV